jgi:hypothetical protein
MSIGTRSLQDLRNIALGIIREDIVCDWLANDHTISTVSESEYLIYTTKDIGMMFERREKVVTHDKNGNPVFCSFHTLTVDEALQVAEMVYRYQEFLNTYAEVVIPHE